MSLTECPNNIRVMIPENTAHPNLVKSGMIYLHGYLSKRKARIAGTPHERRGSWPKVRHAATRFRDPRANGRIWYEPASAGLDEHLIRDNRVVIIDRRTQPAVPAFRPIQIVHFCGELPRPRATTP
jgi:hypothetical protein